MKKYLWLMLLYSTALFSIGEDIHYKKISQEINIISEGSGYTKRVTCKGVFLNKSDKSISIVCNELEKINNFKQIDLLSDKSFPKGIVVNEHSITTDNFYDGLKEFSIQYMDTSMAFGLQYDVLCKHLILLSSFPLVSYPNADTLIYKVKTPINLYLKFKHDTSYRFNVTIDTTLINKYDKTYTITSIPKYKIGIKKGIHSRFEINSFIPPELRVIVTSARENDEWRYFNNWFNLLIKDNIKLNVQSLKVINSFINGSEIEEEIIKKVYEYVNANIKYVSIENGLEAFRPRDVNSILLNKHGDCKDMANVLCQILRNYKLNASIAVISTIDYPYKIDFPSLASANHAICIVKTKTGKIYYLDATDKTSTYYLPSQFIQGQHYFAFNDNGGEISIVPIINSARNSSNLFFNLTVEKSSLTGIIKNEYMNYSGSAIKYITKYSTESEAKLSISHNLNQENPNIKYTNIKTEIIDSIAKINSSVFMNNVLNKIENKNFLLLKFLVFPHQYPKNIKKHFRFITYQTSNAHFFYQIGFNNNIKIISKPSDFSFKDECISFDFNIRVLDESSLVIEYWYKIDKIELGIDEIRTFEKLNENIMKFFNTSLEYEIVD